MLSSPKGTDYVLIYEFLKRKKIEIGKLLNAFI